MSIYGRTQNKFLSSSSGMAAVEFAFVLPVMLLFVLGGFEVVRAITCARRLTYLANAIGQQVTANTTGQIANADMHFVYNSAIPIFPQAMKDASRFGNNWSQDISISVSSIVFTTLPVGCVTNCTYVPAVLWSGGGYRSCISPPSSASDLLTPSATTLPADVFGSGSLIAVDISYTFHTVLSGSFLSNYIPVLNGLAIKRSVYLQPRYVSTIYYHSGTLLPGNDDIVTWCLGNMSS